MELAIKVEDISKMFKDRKQKLGVGKSIERIFFPKYIQALEHISFEVKKGEFFGLLGSNGAGKTTLIKIMLGLLKPDNGNVKILNHDPLKERSKISHRINAVFARAGLYWALTGRDNLKFYAKLYSVKDSKEKINQLVEIFDLQEKIDYYLESYSTGEAMRLNLARSLLNEPEVLLLDEPTIGLDPNIALKVRDFAAKINKENKITIVLTTHYMKEADDLCKRIAIINKGKIIRIDTSKSLKKELQKEHIIEIKVPNYNKRVIDRILEIDGVVGLSFSEEQEEIRVILKDLDILDSVVSFLKKNKQKLGSIHTSEPTLEDVFVRLTKKEE